MTYSIGTDIESKVINIIGATSVDFTPLLDKLQDNINGDINPDDIRDTILTLHTNIELKSDSYISMGTYSNTKMYFGKRSYNNIDILDTTLLNSDSDLYFYNIKPDSISNNSTKLSINSDNYIQSRVIQLTQSQSLELNIIAKNDINISGNVKINNINFPNNNINNLDNKTLFYNNGDLIFEDLSLSITSSVIGATNTTTEIYGDVLLNGYELSFTEERGCPINIGDIKVGDNFNNESIENVLRRMVYNYLPPDCTLELIAPYNNGFVEIGTSPNIKLQYNIIKKSNPLLPTILTYMQPNVINSVTMSTIGIADAVITLPIKNNTNIFNITVNDNITSVSATTSLTGVYPYFYGFSDLPDINNSELTNLSKLIENNGNKELFVYGSGDFYFIQDSNYPILTDIIYNEDSILASFSTYTKTLSSPNGYWYNKEFRVYKYENLIISDISKKIKFISEPIYLNKVLINNGDETTDNSIVNITLEVSGYDTPTLMRYSSTNEDLEMASWITFSDTFIYDLGSSSGEASIYVQIKSDNAISLIKSDSISIIKPFITFIDPIVKQICVNNWGSDGEITYEQAATVTDLGDSFEYLGSNAPVGPITSFNELQYFTSLLVLKTGSNGNGVFEGADQLVEITLPPNLTTIDSYCFTDCSSLTNIIIPPTVIELGRSVFSGCSSLTGLILPDAITIINDNLFYGCSALTDIIIPDAVTMIGQSAFNRCSNISTLNIPGSVTSIGHRAFANMTILSTITFHSITPIELTDYLFSENKEMPPSLTSIFVPSDSVDAYKAAPIWSEYADIISAIV